MLQQGQPAWASEYLSAVVSTLCATDVKTVKIAVLEALAELDRASLGRLVDADGLEIAFLALTSEDRETVEQALAVAEAANHPYAIGGLTDLHESMPDGLRERALALADKLTGDD